MCEERAGRVAQVVACLIYKHETLSSNPSPTKKQNKTKQKDNKRTRRNQNPLTPVEAMKNDAIILENTHVVLNY
jgi:hypothetical protein